ncbi:hypothetical protein F8388_008344 [Cannabis sativa]|uniref:RNase H type-1 domain-containing protein n=1 Tax=Cannabis sativa TaxID=3483 RepID=A0A7J6GM61_CANSA|nr:hypothetical protein F8388_008344 [Cannabis sativa]KAF4383973.1 hypothetical protein G4B88_016406 [Cannabis sativa]
MNKLHFTEISYVSPIGLSGGFGVCWKQGVLCKIMEADKNVLIGTIESDPPGISWNFMGIYGPPSMTGREFFWNRIGDMLANGSSPTVLLGDLNGTLADHECLYYTNQNNAARYSFDLRRMVARIGLIDLGCLGGKFTWFQKTSNSTGSNAIRRARLDRALASTDWRILFPNAIVELLTVSTSDHKPILLNTDGGVRCTKAQFKYELMWGRDPRCFWVVRNAWRERLHHNPMVNLYRKLKRTRDHLQRWNKTHFKKIHQQVTEAKNDLAKIESNDQISWPLLSMASRAHVSFVGKKLKNSLHLFWKCTFTKAIWFSIGWGIRTEMVTATDWKQWMEGFWKGPNLPPNIDFYDFMVTCLCIVESVWKERNRRVHGEMEKDIMQISRSIRQKINDHIMVSKKIVHEITEWRPPPLDWVCCNSDVAVSPVGSILSAVIRDDMGNIISISSQESRVTLPKLAEAKAVCLAAEKAKDLGLKKIMFQSDNIGVVKAFEASMDICMDFMLQDSKVRFNNICSKFSDWGIVHVSRKCNYMAHNIAKWAAVKNVLGNICHEEVEDSVLDDLREYICGIHHMSILNE